jgi:xanthine dehydrogenase accessory factor
VLETSLGCGEPTGDVGIRLDFVYDLALSVLSCLGAGTSVELAWLVDVSGLDYRGRADAMVVTPGGGRIGSVLGGALDARLADLAAEASRGRLVEVPVAEFEAVLAGLTGHGTARCLLLPATDLPEQLWPLLQRREPLCLVTELDGNRAVATRVFTRDTIADAGPAAARIFRRGSTDTAVSDGTVITALWPVPRLVIVGGGQIAEALEANARLLGWAPQRLGDASAAVVIGGLSALDGLVVTTHDREVDGPALAAALAGAVGYIGALGARAMQQARAAWLAERGIASSGRIHGPAGLDIGARTPAEVAVAIIAEMLAIVSR